MTDDSIVKLYFERSELAITETKNRYEHLCKAIINNIVTSEQDVEECINDTYLRLWNTIPPQKPVSLKAYVVRIARFIAIDKYRYNKARLVNSEIMVLLSELEECIPSGDNVYSEIESGELVSKINCFLASLDASSRKIFVSRYFFSDPIREICTAYGLKESAVKMRLKRTREKLRIYLEKEWEL